MATKRPTQLQQSQRLLAAKVLGVEELTRALKALPAELTSKRGGVVLAAVRAAANVIAREARLRAPERGRARPTKSGTPSHPPGRLKRAITTRRTKDSGTGKEHVTIGIRRGRKRNDTKGAWYGLMVELGTMGGEKPDQRPQRFVRDAFASKKDAAFHAFRQRFKSRIKQAERKLAQQFNTHKAARNGR